MIATASKTLAVGDSVHLVHDPSEEAGVIVSETVNKGQWLVAWKRGKVWIHPTVDLVPVAST